MKTLYIHIGVHRTATSSIQEFMGKNRANLLKRGYLYPFGVRRHFKLMQHMFSNDSDIDQIAANLLLRSNNKSNPVHSVVISDEDICMRRDLSKLETLRKYFNVKIIFCLRRQDLWLESWYLQNIKWQWNPKLSHLSFDQFRATQEDYFWIDYDNYLKNLEQIFGQENIQVYTFERSQMPQGPVAAFTDQIKLGNLDGLGALPNKNYSLAPITSEFMRRLPLDTATPRHRSNFESAFEKLDAHLRENHPSSGSRSKLLLTPEQRKIITKEFAKGNKAVAKRYFNRKKLFLDPLPNADAELANPQLPADSNILIETMVAPLLEELIKVYKDYLPK